MAKTKEQKKEIIKNLNQKIENSNSIVFIKFDALGVKDNDELRRKLKEEDSEYYVAKKTLLDIVFKDKKNNDFQVKDFEGKIAVVFGYKDEVAPAKIVNEFKKLNKDKIEFIGGLLEGKFMSSREVSDLACLPGKQELYAKLVGSLNAPISNFVSVINGNTRKLIYVLSAIKESKE
ncbi:50S ribosomal protein L10 [Candidatus Falkowbacteria bacterium]|nr:MAG: 50S ribosomal protein L10 [Candidatus Falkowbacteria bacterium]